jgi:hypothetical protein
MSASLDSLLEKRNLVLQDMRTIDRLRRGTLSKQFFKAVPGKSGRRGPYFLLQGFFRGKKFNERIPAEQAPQVQQQVDNYRRFQTLAEQYVTLSDQITRLESGTSDRKKNSSLKNSPMSNSRKPKPS